MGAGQVVLIDGNVTWREPQPAEFTARRRDRVTLDVRRAEPTEGRGWAAIVRDEGLGVFVHWDIHQAAAMAFNAYDAASPKAASR